MHLSKFAHSRALSVEKLVQDFWLSSMTALTLVALTCSGSVVAGTLNTQIQEDLSIGEQLVTEENRLNRLQEKLVDRRTSLLAMGVALDREQQTLNRDMDLHNQQVSEQKKVINLNREQCNNKGNLDDENTKEHINQCNNSIKTINGSSTAIDAQSDTLASRQADLNVHFANYHKEVDAWNKQAVQNSDSLNKNHKSTTNWLNFSYVLLASPDFQQKVRTTGQTPTCGSGTKKIEASAQDPVDVSARFVLACLGAVKLAEK